MYIYYNNLLLWTTYVNRRFVESSENNFLNKKKKIEV